MTGIAGRLLAGCRPAATLGRWSLVVHPSSAEDPEWTVDAEVTDRDEFRLLHDGPFELRLRVGRGDWCWSGVTADVAGHQGRLRGHGGPRGEIDA